MANRQIVYTSEVPFERDILNTQMNGYIGLAKLTAGVLGVNTLLNGLGAAPTGPATLTVDVSAGEIYSLENVDDSSYGVLPADTTHQIVKQGISLDTVNLSTPAPVTPGESVKYLIQVGFTEVDNNNTSRPYYNSADPASPTFNLSAETRADNCEVQVKAGIAAPTGTEVAPAPDAGFIGAYIVTVAEGQTEVNAGDIIVDPTAPFITETLTQKISEATGNALYLLKNQQTSNYNYLINGGMRVDQRVGPHTIADNTPTYTLDRWKVHQVPAVSGTVVVSAIKNDNKPVMQIDKTVVGDPGDLNDNQYIEDVSIFSGKTISVKFEINVIAGSGLTAETEIEQYFGTGGSPSASVITTLSGGPISLSSGLQTLQYTVAVPSISGKTLGTDDNSHATIFRVKLKNDVLATYQVSEAQLVIGPNAPAFEYRGIAEEIDLATRYYEKTYNAIVSPGAVDINGRLIGISGTNSQANIKWTYKANKRVSASVLVYSDLDGASGFVTDGGTNTAVGSIESGESSVIIVASDGGWAIDTISAQATADADF